MEYLRKMLFFANIASNLKVESMHFAHRYCEYILGVTACSRYALECQRKNKCFDFKPAC